jgi:hypothetical protein
MIVVYNPTDEDLKGWHIGIEFTIQAGTKQKLEDATAKHLLNHLGPRGLMMLEYGDEEREDQITAEGRRINREFKKKQIRIFNETNEQRKAVGLTYNNPTPEIKKYSNELGIQLTEPYAMKVEGMGDFAQTQKQITELQKSWVKK